MTTALTADTTTASRKSRCGYESSSYTVKLRCGQSLEEQRARRRMISVSCFTVLFDLQTALTMRFPFHQAGAWQMGHAGGRSVYLPITPRGDIEMIVPFPFPHGSVRENTGPWGNGGFYICPPAFVLYLKINEISSGVSKNTTVGEV